MTKRRRGRRRAGNALTETAKLYRAFKLLSEQIPLKHESSAAKQLAAKLRVEQVGKTSWQVSGGQCQHLVTLNGHLTCADHSPAHQPTLEGFACSHEIAVRRALTRQMVREVAI